MSATGDETVTLSQLKEWSDTLGGGGGFSPATSTVTITNNSSITEPIVHYMGVDGTHTSSSLKFGDFVIVQVPIMSVVLVYGANSAEIYGGVRITSSVNSDNVPSVAVAVMDTKCTITTR